MKTILMAASALSLLAAPAMAQVGPSVAVITAGVAPKCALAPSSTIGGTNYIAFNMPINGDGRVTTAAEWVDVVDAKSMFGAGDVWCNTAATVKVTGTPLLHSTLPLQNNHARPAADEFTKILDLDLQDFAVGGISFPAGRLNTGAGLDFSDANNTTGTATVSSTGPFAGDVDGTLRFYGHEPRRFVAGSYRSQWTLTVTAN